MMTNPKSKVELNQPVEVTTQRTLTESCNIMKRLSLVLVGVGCMLFQSAQATYLFQEGFNYTAGTFLGANANPGTGYTWGTGSSATMEIASGNLTYTDGGGSLYNLGGGELQNTWGGGTASSDINVFGNVTSGTLYYSFLLDVTTAPTANSYLTALNAGTTTPGGSTDAINLTFGSIAGGGSFRFGVRGSGASAVYTPTATPYALNTTYLVVLGYNWNGGVLANNVNLWIDPTVGGSMPTATLTLAATTLATGIDNVGFKVQSTPSGAFDIDNLLISQDWADVVVAAPEPGTFALAGLGMLGLILVRRVRR